MKHLPQKLSPPKAMFKQPTPVLQTTSLWDFPSQHYGNQTQGDQNYEGVTPSYIIWNLLQRYTHPGATVVDPMCGSGTTLDVCKDLKRKGIGFDLASPRPDIKPADARSLPLAKDSADFIFLDPPYGQHIRYSGKPACIGELDSRDGSYTHAMNQVLKECTRVLKTGGYLGLYIQDSFAKGKPFAPLGFEVFALLAQYLEPVDVICVARHNRTMKRNHWHTAALEGNYFLRGFNYLFVFRKNPKNDPTLRHHDRAGTASTFCKAKLTEQRAQKDKTVLTPEDLSQMLPTS